ncbi:hypothetical protein SCWH03_46660 [Streptomyces pacificus]|uniref:Diaminobutyrate--2-oxoglutarate transaminase n=1 Tax=Streptomyces pacificus TaxID=2705029 RepID=A0A6A0B293_9ACTN|nr:hypothetical protein SCWH03_46660 [Streptomyces pacificus]
MLSKAIGGSLPLAVIVYRTDLDVWRPGAHAGAFRGNQLAMAAGAATLAFVRENLLAERAAALGARMLGRLQGLAATHRCVGDVPGRGLMIGVELVRPDTDAPPAAAPQPGVARAGVPGGGVPPAAPVLAAAVQRECLRRGLIVEVGGRHRGVVRLLPPLTLTDEQAEAVLDRFADSLEAAVRAPHHRDDTGPSL